jgi:hypothetical protein
MAVKWVRAGVKAKVDKSKKQAPKTKARKKISVKQEEEAQKLLRKAAVDRMRERLKKKRQEREAWIPPAMADAITDAVATRPKGEISLGMQEILYPASERRIYVVRATKGAVTNKEEFTEAMAALNITVVFLEFSANMCAPPPSLEMIPKA